MKVGEVLIGRRNENGGEMGGHSKEKAMSTQEKFLISKVLERESENLKVFFFFFFFFFHL